MQADPPDEPHDTETPAAEVAPQERAPTAGHEADAPTPVTIACGCRRTLRDPSVISEPRYSIWATATLLFGITAAPKAVDFQCLKCHKVIATATDAATIRRFTQ